MTSEDSEQTETVVHRGNAADAAPRRSADPDPAAAPRAAHEDDVRDDAPVADPGDSRPARDEAPQFVLPLVVRIERAAPPTRTDALETAARAVLVMLSDPRAQGDGPWAQAVRDWQDGRIRKVVRRARGAEWRRVQALDGITVTGATAEVRVFPPVPLDGWPKDLSRLQVSGTHLDDPEPPADADAETPVLWISPHIDMTAGKTMAQAGHGAQLAWWDLSDAERTAWREAGFPLSVRTADPSHWHTLTTTDGVPVVHDAGFTEIAPGETVAVEGHHRVSGPGVRPT